MNAVTNEHLASMELVDAPTQKPATSSALALHTPHRPFERMLVAAQSGIGLDQIEKMMELEERWEKREAEKAYNESLSAFKSAHIKITKTRLVDFNNSKGGRTTYKHATLDDVVSAVGPVLSEHGMSWSWFTEQQSNNMIAVTCVLRHRLGHSESVSLTAPPDNTGGKNTIQAIISTTTYLQRHTLKQICGVAEADEDDDGNGGMGAYSESEYGPPPSGSRLNLQEAMLKIDSCQTVDEVKASWGTIGAQAAKERNLGAHTALKEHVKDRLTQIRQAQAQADATSVTDVQAKEVAHA